MDSAVAIVNAYLQLNGYFTVTEYPIIEADSHGARARTDIDILAMRFPGAGRLVSKPQFGCTKVPILPPDIHLNCPPDKADMIIGEVKEGKAEFNERFWDPIVLRSALARFGCCSFEHAETTAEELLRRGHALTHSGHWVRLVAFGSSPDRPHAKHYEVISLGHVYDFLIEYIREHWDVVQAAEFKDPAFGFLVVLEKAIRDRNSRLEERHEASHV